MFDDEKHSEEYVANLKRELIKDVCGDDLGDLLKLYQDRLEDIQEDFEWRLRNHAEAGKRFAECYDERCDLKEKIENLEDKLKMINTKVAV